MQYWQLKWYLLTLDQVVYNVLLRDKQQLPREDGLLDSFSVK